MARPHRGSDTPRTWPDDLSRFPPRPGTYPGRCALYGVARSRGCHQTSCCNFDARHGGACTRRPPSPYVRQQVAFARSGAAFIERADSIRSHRGSLGRVHRLAEGLRTTLRFASQSQKVDGRYRRLAGADVAAAGHAYPACTNWRLRQRTCKCSSRICPRDRTDKRETSAGQASRCSATDSVQSSSHPTRTLEDPGSNIAE